MFAGISVTVIVPVIENVFAIVTSNYWLPAVIVKVDTVTV
jgi:hypothetical protein